jgi:ABC-type multidrug transport system ATPase subunit
MGGLDPAGRSELLNALSKLRRDSTVTIIMTESDPEAVSAFADRLLVLHRPPSQGGCIVLEGSPRELFHRVDRLAALGVAVPQMAQVAVALNERLGTAFDFLTVDEAREALAVHLA